MRRALRGVHLKGLQLHATVSQDAGKHVAVLVARKVQKPSRTVARRQVLQDEMRELLAGAGFCTAADVLGGE